MGNTQFNTLEVKKFAKDMQAIQQDAQVIKASTPMQKTERYIQVYVCNFNLFLNLENLFANNNICPPALFFL